MKMIDCLVADDEPLAREVIEGYIVKTGQLHLIATCSNGIEVFNALKTKAAELLFLDIQMPQLTGIELLRTLKNPPAVIITTAFREFAIEGYELNVLDYLLKPISFERFLKAVDKYQLPANPRHLKIASFPDSDKNDKADGPAAFTYVKSDKRMVRVMLRDLLYIEGLKDYVRVHTPGGAIITYQTLTYFEEKLSADQFIRIHRSYIVSLNHIHAYSATQVEIGKVSIPIGSSYAKEVIRKLSSRIL
jgi:DNA-binding LytR/AlgR family response regulator